jgi:hypothetical protein
MIQQKLIVKEFQKRLTRYLLIHVFILGESVYMVRCIEKEEEKFPK